MMAHQNRAARLASQMEVLGPNPELMMQRILDDLKVKLRNDPKIDDKDRKKLAQELQLGQTRIGQAFNEVSGLTLAPVSLTWATIGSAYRAVQSTSKLGAAVISSITDLASIGINLRFHGKPLLQTWSDQIVSVVKGRGTDEEKEIAFALGEGFDGIVGHLVSPYVAHDGVPGMISQAMERFFRWQGLTLWTDSMRAGAARMLSANMANRMGQSFGELDARFKHGLDLQGITAEKWEVLRQAKTRLANGRDYVTADAVARLSDEAVAPLLPQADIDRARAYFKGNAKRFAAWRVRRIDEARLELQMDLQRYIADETSFAMVQSDDQTRRYMYRGTRPGTMVGEALRLIWQFKAFPVAFTGRVVGRAVLDSPGGKGHVSAAQRRLLYAGHMGALMATLLVAGYGAMTAKDLLRGYWPPRDPLALKTFFSAMGQSGGLGIYTDFLFGQATGSLTLLIDGARRTSPVSSLICSPFQSEIKPPLVAPSVFFGQSNSAFPHDPSSRCCTHVRCTETCRPAFF